MPRLTKKTRSLLAVVIPAGVLAVGLVAGPLISAEWKWRSPLLSEVQQLTSLAPISALPRTEAVIATVEAQRLLDAGRPYAAWEIMRGNLDAPGVAGAAANIVAARAAAAWGGWREVTDVLRDRPWLETTNRGEGLLLLARAEEETGNPNFAMAAYERYLALESAEERGVASARLARLLSSKEDYAAAAQAYATAVGEMPEIADWLQTFQVEQLVLGGDPSVTTIATRLSGGSAPARQRRVQLEVEAWVVSAETNRAIDRLEWEARILNASGSPAEAAMLHLDRAELLLEASREAEGRALLAFVAGSPRATAATRRAAAERLEGLGNLNAAEALAVASGYEAASQPGLAARALRAALDAGASDDGTQRLRLARLLYEERDYVPARSAFERAAEMLADQELKAEAQLYAARSLYRSGSRGKANAIAEFRRVVDRYPGTAAAGSALFLLGDEATTLRAGLDYYRRAANIPSSPDAREALFRVGDRSLKLDDRSGAIRAWQEYVDRYPRGDATAQVAYEAGKLLSTSGQRERAIEMYRAATVADPTSYYAVRASERAEIGLFDQAVGEPRPWIGLASESGDAARVLERIDRLEAIGHYDEARAELDSALRRFEDQPLALITLAEGLRDRHKPVEALNIGRSLLAKRNGEWDDRLLRVVFPFPYRELIETEARRAGIDPILFAALIRQESTFRPSVKSWVGATGLGQIMPATGRWLAPSVGIRDYRQELLEVPEVNLRMGAKYLGDLLKRYDGAADLALAGYNAGPGRADRWRRTLGYGRDTDAFRAAIPFNETRNYVMIVLRNRAIYEALYGDGRN